VAGNRHELISGTHRLASLRDNIPPFHVMANREGNFEALAGAPRTSALKLVGWSIQIQFATS
jgi:hypothetical protein